MAGANVFRDKVLAALTADYRTVKYIATKMYPGRREQSRYRDRVRVELERLASTGLVERAPDRYELADSYRRRAA